MFIQMIQGECERQDEMRGLVDTWCGLMADRPGWLGGTYGFTDDGMFVGVVRYESREACAECCSTEDAAMCFAAAETLFSGGYEVHESDDALMMLDGGSDDAGFVQVMHGQVKDPTALREFVTDRESTEMMHQARPEIIGATLMLEDDGTFTETVFFTDEAAAREGESQRMPEQTMRRMEAAMADVEFIDLHRPWFASHH